MNGPSQRDIVAHLIEHEEVYELAKSIGDFGGLYPNESLIAVEEDGKKVVVEGNRRLAALKLLASPGLAPENCVNRFRSLSHHIGPQAIEKVEVVMAPSRSVAARLIVARHTGDVVKRWSRAQQAKYIRTLVKPDHTIEEVATEIQMTAGDIRVILKTDTMIQLAHVSPISDEVRATLEDQSFSWTTLERFVQSSSGQKFLGITFDADGNAVGDINKDEFKKAYARVVTDISTGKINTRNLNTAHDIDTYLSGFGKDKPDKSKKSTWTSNELLSGKTKAAKEAIHDAKKPKPAIAEAKLDPYLIPKAFRCGLKQPKILEILGELRKLKLSDYPNACAVLVRIFIELTVGHYLSKTGKDKPLLDKIKKENKGLDWAPTLRQMMRVILADTTITIKPHTRKALERIVNKDDSWLSLDHVDQFVHNQHITPNERDLRMLWSAVEPLMEKFMVEPSPALPSS